jgi:hypothetical protein
MMMNDAYQQGGGPFAEIDPKLTVFALANGVDLSKAEDHRRLEWFAEGFERSILIGSDAEGAFGVALFKWKTGGEPGEPNDFRSGVDATELVSLLDAAVEAANAL